MIRRSASLAPFLAAAFLASGLLACGETREPDDEVDTRRDSIRRGFLEGAAGARLHFRVLGRGSDTLVVVHGGPGSGMGTVIPDLKPLAEDHLLIFYDQRGGGRSTLPADDSLLDAHHFVEDLERLRRHFGIDRMNVLAHSFGPIIVARYALEHPDRLGRVIFTGAVGPLRADAAKLARGGSAGADPALSEAANAALGRLMSDTLSDPVEACREFERLSREVGRERGEPVAWQGTSCDMPPEAIRYYFQRTARVAPRRFGDWDFTRGLEDLEAPLLVVWGYAGEPDSLVLEAQRQWAASVPQGRLLLVPGAEKAGYASRPDLVFPAIDQFLDGGWPDRAETVEQ